MIQKSISHSLLSLCLLALIAPQVTAETSEAWAQEPVAGQVTAGASVDKAIIKIYTIHNNPDYYNPWNMLGPANSTGSGCVIDGKRILTNAHVVRNQTFIQVRRHGDSKRYVARLISASHDTDLALLTVDDPKFFEGITPLQIGELPATQEEVLVYGFPLGGDTMSITKGVISRVEHQLYVHSTMRLLAGQLDAAINPGNSGGPVIHKGKIVGVVMQSRKSGENIGYMVPVPVLQHVLGDLIDGTLDGIPTLGIYWEKIENADMKRRLKMSEEQSGVSVINILPGSSSLGHLQEGDVLLSVDGYSIDGDGSVEFRPNERTLFGYFVQQHQIGEEIDLEILRDGQVKKGEL